MWAGGAGVGSTTNEQLADLLEAIGGPAVGWTLHPDLVLPSGARAEALAIPVRESLMWLLGVGAEPDREGVGASVAWLGRIALLGVRLVARGAVVPGLRSVKRADGRSVEWAVKWGPALLDDAEVGLLAAAMPGPIVAFASASPRATTVAVLGAVVDTIVSQAAGLLELPAPPPTASSASAVAEAFTTRLDGSPFRAPVGPAGQISRRLDQWTRSVVGSTRPRLVVQLEPPDGGDAWLLTVLGPGAEGGLLQIEVALGDSRSTKPMADELVRLERLLPVLRRPGGLRRGQVVLSQDEAWELMTLTGTELEAAGFDVRVPALSRRKPTPGLRLFADAGR